MTTPNLFGTDLLGRPVNPRLGSGTLAGEFMVPPFSVLNCRDGRWQRRKRAWVALGIKSELGRQTSRNGTAHTNDLRGGLTFRITNSPYNPSKRPKNPVSEAGTSIFDPVLAELVYRWFCKPGGLVLDPFAGGSCRGIVAGSLGLKYYGIDLSQAQCRANVEQRDKILPGMIGQIVWHAGDARPSVEESAPRADFVFSCPPYGNLERYSDDPRDLSTLDWPKFKYRYQAVIDRCAEKLRNNRFAAFVVSNFRGGHHYHDLVGETVRDFESAGMGFYNECIVVNAVGSLAVRTRSQWTGSRKLGKTHQNLLVFVKGCPKKATRTVLGE